MKVSRAVIVADTAVRVTIELDETELYNAYLEQERKFDIQTVKNYITEADRKEFKQDFGVGKKIALKFATDIAKEMRRRIDHDNLDWQTAAEQSIKAVCGGDKQ